MCTHTHTQQDSTDLFRILRKQDTVNVCGCLFHQMKVSGNT